MENATKMTESQTGNHSVRNVDNYEEQGKGEISFKKISLANASTSDF